KKLYNKFDDWHLAIAAYNCGPGNIDKAIARSGGHRTFWEIYNYLPQETRAYVPFFIAATYVMTYHCEHGLCGSVTDIPVECDTVMVNRMVHFEQIAHCLNLPMEVVESLNPQYIRDIVPGSPEKPHSITLPANKSISFLERQDSIFASKAETLLPRNGRITEVSTRGRRNEYVRQGGNHGSSGSTASSSRIYTVRKGESLGSIARKHHTTSAKIKKLNKLRSDRIHPGQKLRLP
ncbi:MAG: LysM peptidoglycan-binding domain-containing protein, partial [Bacteroidales bacterium]|nr:LysM peptidoglycan-binding domain-containing protein [Bacteroidales bacterium]